MRAARAWAAAAAIAGAFLLAGSRHLDAPGLNLDEGIETSFGMELALGLPRSPTDWSVSLGGRAWPLRAPHPYDFSAFTVYWSALAFRVGGVSALTLRWAGLAAAALVLLFFFGFCLEWFGPGTAALATALAAAHPAFLLPARCSFYFAELFVLLPETAALWLLSVWHRRRAPWALYLGCFLWAAGLNVSIKALAFFVAAPLAYALTARQKELPSRAQACAAAGCAALGALNPLLFTLKDPGLARELLSTLASPTKAGVRNWLLLRHAVLRAGHLMEMLGGAPASVFAGPAPAVDRLSQAAFAAAFLALAAACRRRGARGERRAVSGVLLLVAALAGSTCLTPRMLTPHHTLICWPLPLLVVALGVERAARALPRRFPYRAAIPAALAACLLASEARVDAAWLSRLAQTGGDGLWSDAVTGLAAYLDQNGIRRPAAMAGGLSENLYVLTSGRVQPVEEFVFGSRADPYSVRARWRSLVSDPKARLLLLAEGVDPVRTRALRLKLRNALLASRRHLVVEKAFADRAGAPVYLLCSARPGGDLAAAAP